MSRKEEKRLSKIEEKTAVNAIQTKTKFTRKDSSPLKHLLPIDNMIRRMTAGELIKKSDTMLDRKLILEEVGQKVTQHKDDNTNTENYLNQLKKGHDELVKMSCRKQSQTCRMREQIEMIKRKVKGSTSANDSQKNYLEEMDKRWEMLKLKQETTALSSKTLEHIMDRMKKDEVVHQLKINDLEERVRQLTTQLTEITTKNMSLHELEALSSVAVHEVKGNYVEAHEQRKKDVAHYESIIHKRKEADQREQERQRITDDIQAMAASDLNDSNMIRWKKLLLVQKFLKKLLKSKINDLELKYSEVKRAFYTIKMRTNVTDPASLTSCYFNLEDTYQKLLETVRNLEGKVDQLESQKKDLDGIHEQVRSELLLLEQDRDSKADPTLARRAFELTQKSFQSELARDRIYFWLISNIYKLDVANDKSQGSREKYYQLYPKDKLNDHLERFCSELRETRSTGNDKSTPIRYERLRTLEATTSKDPEEDEDLIEREDLNRRDIKKTTKLLV